MKKEVCKHCGREAMKRTRYNSGFCAAKSKACYLKQKRGVGLCNICKKNPKVSWSPTYCKECYRTLDIKRYYKNHVKRLRQFKSYYEKNKSKWIETFKKSSARYPEKKRAREILRNAVITGVLVRKPCEVCGKKLKIHAHHDDYKKPLKVNWLCAKHHAERHRKYDAKKVLAGDTDILAKKPRSKVLLTKRK